VRKEGMGKCKHLQLVVGLVLSIVGRRCHSRVRGGCNCGGIYVFSTGRHFLDRLYSLDSHFCHLLPNRHVRRTAFLLTDGTIMMQEWQISVSNEAEPTRRWWNSPPIRSEAI